MTNDCKTCPVSTGTHKPAEAVHQIDEPQAEALRLADDCEESATHWVHEIDTRAKAAKMLCAQNARIAELEQRLEIDPRHRYDGISARDATIEAQDERIAELEAELAALKAANPTHQGLDARDAAFEAVRKAFCNLQRYSFLLDSRGNVRRCADHSGNWVEFEAVHTLFEPQSVDAALAAQAKQGAQA